LTGFVTNWASDRSQWTPAILAVGAAVLVLALALAIALLPLVWAILLVVGGGITLITLIHPQLGVLLIVLAVPFGSLRQVRVGVMNVGAAEVLVALVLVAWLMRMVARREIRWRWPPLSLPLLGLLGAMLLSTLVATSLQHSIKEIIKWGEVLVLYLMVSNEMDERWIKGLLFAILGTGALVALHGIYQFLFQVGPEEFVLFGRFMRAYGTFEQPNPYAGYLGLTLPLAVGLVAATFLSDREKVSGWWLIWAGGCGALMLAALIMSWSRGAWLGFAAAIAIMTLAVILRRGRAAVLILFFLFLTFYFLLAGGLNLLPQAIMQRFSDFVPYLDLVDVRGMEITDANFAVLERMAHWQSALAMWTDHPWLGVGVGNYEVAYTYYALPLWTFPLGHAHNYYLNIAAEAGVLGLLAYLLLWGTAWLFAWRVAKRSSRMSGWHWAIALGVLGVVTHLAVHSFFDNLFVHDMYLHLGILLAILPISKWRSRNLVTHSLNA
jgi:O-antigen ligase